MRGLGRALVAGLLAASGCGGAAEVRAPEAPAVETAAATRPPGSAVPSARGAPATVASPAVAGDPGPPAAPSAPAAGSEAPLRTMVNGVRELPPEGFRVLVCPDAGCRASYRTVCAVRLPEAVRHCNERVAQRLRAPATEREASVYSGLILLCTAEQVHGDLDARYGRPPGCPPDLRPLEERTSFAEALEQAAALMPPAPRER